MYSAATVVLTSPQPRLTLERRISARRLAAGGLALAALILGIGAAFELWHLGPTDAAARQRLERKVRADFVTMIARVQAIARDVAISPDVPRSMSGDPAEGAHLLFDVAARGRHQAPDVAPLLAITIYDARGMARAWAGRPSDLPPELTAAAALFVTPSPLGLRLVNVQPIVAVGRERSSLGSVAVEHVLSPAPAVSTITARAEYVMPTSIAPVILRPLGAGAAAPLAAHTIVINGPDGAPLVEASVAPADLAAARQRLRRTFLATALAVVGVTVLLLTGPLLDRRVRAGKALRELRLSAGVAALVLAGTAALWQAMKIAHIPSWDPPLRLLLTGAAAAAIVATVVSGAVRLRVALRTSRHWPEDERVLFVLAQLTCGVALAALLVVFERLLGRYLDPASVDLRHFSLHPWTGTRLATLTGILLCHAAVLWAGALACVVAIARWRLPRRLSRWHVAAALCWIVPIVIAAAIAAAREWAVPALAVVIGAVASAAAGLLAPQLTVWYRQTTVASRILALFMAFLLPALLIYPSVHFFADRATRRVIATRYAVEAMNHPQTLQDRLAEALTEIDAAPLAQLVSDAAAAAPNGLARTDAAFLVWSRTALARARLTSGIELYDGTGALVSRFALNFPEYTGAAQTPESGGGCRWNVFSEAQPFGAEERRMLHAERSVCDAAGNRVGAIVVHVVWDYRTLPFITSQSPYFEVFRSQGQGPSIEGAPTGDVEVVIYGWGLRSVYTSGRTAWPLDEATFARIYRSRDPFWTTLSKDDTSYRVYISNDRGGIYAIGYPIPDLFEHLVRLAELTTLAAAGYVIILIATSLYSRIARLRPHTGRALLREIRASFHRKLFLAFVLASIVPVVILALVIRSYFAGLLVDGIEGEAARTAAVAQRVIEESNAMLRRGTEGLAPFGDDVMVWISQVINQDVNIFYGPRLFATSERDLFASGLLPTRTPEDVYRAIVLQRLPSYVTQDSIGSVPYMLAATPVRTGARDAILTVPLALRQQEVEREIDDLDRGVHLAALFFILLGAGIGLSMAERIADPVRRLTRATGRIARGDLDARIVVRSSDELRRLVDAFNSMAAELKAQRGQLERTHRLEAWAEMARQVAHEIKNPLTPIQLSAEHLRRVHADRGEPLGAVLEGCIASILGQVRLLRQIASEFSSFASSPTARPAAVDPVQLVHDVLEPYRLGLEGRIALRNQVTGPLPLVLVDGTLVARALANIVENALHAMPGRGGLLLAGWADDQTVTIQIQDTGAGMDADALQRAFEPYFSTKTTGTGLGLPIARRNIELSGGSVSVTSEKGHGTTVTIRLPVAVPA